MNRRTVGCLTFLLLFSLLLSGCYYCAARNEMMTAEKLISELKSQGGDKAVPYEYTSAEKFLEISRMEFNENDYKSAKEFAERSKSSGQAGLSKVKANK